MWWEVFSPGGADVTTYLAIRKAEWAGTNASEPLIASSPSPWTNAVLVSEANFFFFSFAKSLTFNLSKHRHNVTAESAEAATVAFLRIHTLGIGYYYGDTMNSPVKGV